MRVPRILSKMQIRRRILSHDVSHRRRSRRHAGTPEGYAERLTMIAGMVRAVEANHVEAKRKASFCEQKEAKKLFSNGSRSFQRHSPS